MRRRARRKKSARARQKALCDAWALRRYQTSRISFSLALAAWSSLVDVAVGQLLDLVEGPLLVVLADHLVLEQLLDGFVGVAADVADGHPVVLGAAVQVLDDFLAALLGERAGSARG